MTAEVEAMVLRVIGDPKSTQRDVGLAYSALVGDTTVDWWTLNTAIIERWSVAGLKRVKKFAWDGGAA